MCDKLLGCTTFVATAVPHDECGSNGLPVTPNSIKILGLAQGLKKLRHKNVCEYIDFRCTKHNRIFCVSECFKLNVLQWIEQPTNLGKTEWDDHAIKVSYGILEGLAYLNEKGFVHQGLSSKNVFLTKDFVPKLSDYGLYHMTEDGSLIDSPIGDPKYLSPEQICAMYRPDPNTTASIKSDVWSAAIITIEILNRCVLWKDETVKSILVNILKLTECKSSQSALFQLEESLPRKGVIFEENNSSPKFKFILENSLCADQQARMTPNEIIKNSIFQSFHQVNDVDNRVPLRQSLVDTIDCDIDPMDAFTISQLWHLWNLAGGDMMSCVQKTDSATPAIRTLPLFISLPGLVHGLHSSSEDLFDPSNTVLSLDAVRKRLDIAATNADLFYPLLESESPLEMEHATSKLPMLIKENDFEYQVYRLTLFRRLLIGYPFLRDKLWKESRVDIPVYYRGRVWGGLLDVVGDIDEEYLHIDKETPTISDRQIAVDVPRCHQYNAILSSPVAHEKLKRVLKAWLSSHPHLSYWQGLDSLCAVFVHLNFNDEPLAYKSMSQFIDKYLYNFFLKDNSPVIQEYLVVFAQLVSFHDPALSCHMNEIGFIPDLYAIPWFLTMFAHVFPLHKIVHLWDTLLLGNSSFPLCIGVAILLHVRDQLLHSDFNECILLFSDLPEVNIDNIVQRSIQIFCHTPKSSTYREHAQHKAKTPQKSASYYSEDYNALPRSELSITPVPLSELKEEVCCRISADDLVQLCELDGAMDSKTPAKNAKAVKPRIAVIDIRQPEEFSHGAIPSSFNFPFNGGRPIEPCLQKIAHSKSKVVVIVGNQVTRDDRLFAFELLKAGIKGVCVLHGGIDILKPTGILAIP